MKKLFLVALATIALSCSKDDSQPAENTCVMKVLTLGRGGVPGEPVIHSVEYGTSYDDKVYTEISEAVYNYYRAQYDIAPNPRWRGEVTE